MDTDFRFQFSDFQLLLFHPRPHSRRRKRIQPRSLAVAPAPNIPSAVRRGIFVATKSKQNSSPVGAACSDDAAPTELGLFFGHDLQRCQSYGLPNAILRRFAPLLRRIESLQRRACWLDSLVGTIPATRSSSMSVNAPFRFIRVEIMAFAIEEKNSMCQMRAEPVCHRACQLGGAHARDQMVCQRHFLHLRTLRRCRLQPA
jgi:hypothetical protein